MAATFWVYDSVTAASKIETCNCPFNSQMQPFTFIDLSIVSIMQAKAFPINFWGWQFYGWPADHENLLISHITKPLELEDTDSDFPSGYRHGNSYYSYYKLLEKNLPLL